MNFHLLVFLHPAKVAGQNFAKFGGPVWRQSYLKHRLCGVFHIYFEGLWEAKQLTFYFIQSRHIILKT